MDFNLQTLDSTLLQSPTAQRAYHMGLLKAKREALTNAEWLVWVGRPLLYATLAVSGVHLVHQLGVITPTGVSPLRIPATVFHISTVLTMVGVDSVAAYLVSSKSVASLAGAGTTTRMQYFHLTLTAIVNLSFLLSYTPGLPPFILPLLPILALLSAIMIGLLVPVSIVAVEHAHQVSNAARLALLVETTTLQGIVDNVDNELKVTVTNTRRHSNREECHTKTTLKDAIRCLLENNQPINKTHIAKEHGVNRRTVYRIIDEVMNDEKQKGA